MVVWIRGKQAIDQLSLIQDHHQVGCVSFPARGAPVCWFTKKWRGGKWYSSNPLVKFQHPMKHELPRHGWGPVKGNFFQCFPAASLGLGLSCLSLPYRQAARENATELSNTTELQTTSCKNGHVISLISLQRLSNSQPFWRLLRPPATQSTNRKWFSSPRASAVTLLALSFPAVWGQFTTQTQQPSKDGDRPLDHREKIGWI